MVKKYWVRVLCQTRSETNYGFESGTLVFLSHKDRLHLKNTSNGCITLQWARTICTCFRLLCVSGSSPPTDLCHVNWGNKWERDAVQAGASSRGVICLLEDCSTHVSRDVLRGKKIDLRKASLPPLKGFPERVAFQFNYRSRVGQILHRKL